MAYAVCGGALQVLLQILRDQNQDPCLSGEFVVACANERNPVVKGFRAEQIVISSITERGLCVKQGRGTPLSVRRPDRRVAFQQVDGLRLETGQTFACEPPLGYAFIDSLVCVVPSKVSDPVVMIVQQTTLQTVANHAHSRRFFHDGGPYVQWEAMVRSSPVHGSKAEASQEREIQWHLVWVLSGTEGRKHSAGHGRTVDERYQEWFISFRDVNEDLNL